MDIEAKTRSAFLCAPVGIPPGACRSDNEMPKSEDELKRILKEGNSKTGFVVQIQPILIPKGFSLRVPVQEYELVGDTLVARRTFTVLYGTRVPENLQRQPSETEAPFREYWLEGSPTQLESELDKGLSQVTRMLSVLITVVHPDGTAPQEWNDLPKGRLLVKAGRTRCSGTPCSGVRVFRDSPEELWLVSGVGFWDSGSPPNIGVVMISLDPNAAHFETNLWLAYFGY